eukprot:CAMPEP_0198145116 /NCGR_PEP_ID=MMETSP1443-20131203/21054_1 /TAXON_ID=186043 /ORGANISM="Entomoneis sp., Strain CCMP2396" /LENGTH=317 /DNA_ID=CAMNT_0043808647 /DNA_START=63 /DNA_END=1013 /DNA_ORIENTATION=+
MSTYQRFIMLALFFSVSCTALLGPKTINPLIARRERIQKTDQIEQKKLASRHDQDLALFVRGGALAIGNSDITSFFGSCIKSLEKQSPMLAGYLRSFLSTIESITGIELVPKKKVAKKKKKKQKMKPGTGASKSSDEKEVTRTEKKKSATLKKKKAASKSASTKASLAKAHVQKELKATSPNYRIQRELKAFLSDPPPNLMVKVGKNLRVWIVTMKGATNTVYEGETFRLRIAFPAQYPTVPPSVYFLPPNIPVHEHVYTNGDICLSLLGKDWRPTMTAQSIAVSILSILSSAQSKSLPMDNSRHAQNKPGLYQKDW